MSSSLQNAAIRLACEKSTLSPHWLMKVTSSNAVIFPAVDSNHSTLLLILFCNVSPFSWSTLWRMFPFILTIKLCYLDLRNFVVIKIHTVSVLLIRVTSQYDGGVIELEVL